MPVELFKLVMTATATNKRISPSIHRYFRKYNSTADRSGIKIIIQATNFKDDNGNNLTAGGITTKTTSNGFYYLFVDGVIQQSGLYTVDKSKLTINSGATRLAPNSPITLIVNNFTPDFTITVS